MNQENQGHGPRSRPQRPMFDIEGQGSAQSGGTGAVPVINDPPARRSGSGGAGGSGGASGGGGRRGGSGGGKGGGRKRPTPKQRKRRRIIAISALGLVVVLVAAAVVYAMGRVGAIQDDPDQVAPLPAEIKTEAIPEYTGKNIITCLVTGIDYNNDTADGYVDDTDKVGNTDLILYLMYNTETQKCNILQIPRDAYVGEDVETDGICKINGVYRNAEDPSARVEALASTIYDQLKLPVDFYVTVDMDAVKAIVGHAGFIQVYVPHEITDEATNNLLIKQGWQNITDQEVEYLLRNRNYPDGDITRMRTQMSFYSALFREFKTLQPLDLVMWMRILTYYVKVGDIGIMQLGGLGQNALGVSGEDITFVRPGYWGSWYTPKKGPLEGINQAVICLDPEDTAEMLNQYFRPEGGEVPLEELNIQTLEMNEYGQAPSEVRTMAAIQGEEPEKPAPY